MQLTAASVVAVDGVSFTLQLTDLLRVQAQRLSNVVGGNGVASKLDFTANAVQDIALNRHSGTFSVAFTETADSIKPSITVATIDLSYGNIV